MNVVVVDYGRGNLRSITRALAHVGADAVVTADAAALESAERVVLPGVGAFGDGMAGLRERGLVEPLRRYCASGRPFLGICLGMQLLMEEGTEFGVHEGLGIVSGRTARLPSTMDGIPVKIPHIGWNRLELGPERKDGALAGLPGDAQVYFVHSYAAVPAEPADILALTPFAGTRFCSALQRGNVVGVQFHPEKSGPVGLAILRRWLTA